MGVRKLVAVESGTEAGSGNLVYDLWGDDEEVYQQHNVKPSRGKGRLTEKLRSLR
jgi:hypothetical protein